MLVIVMNSLLMQLLSAVHERRQRDSPDGVSFNYVCICILQIHLKLPPHPLSLSLALAIRLRSINRLNLPALI